MYKPQIVFIKSNKPSIYSISSAYQFHPAVLTWIENLCLTRLLFANITNKIDKQLRLKSAHRSSNYCTIFSMIFASSYKMLIKFAADASILTGNFNKFYFRFLFQFHIFHKIVDILFVSLFVLYNFQLFCFLINFVMISHMIYYILI